MIAFKEKYAYAGKFKQDEAVFSAEIKLQNSELASKKHHFFFFTGF